MNIFHQEMAAQLKDLASKLRKIGGVQSLDFGKKNGVSTSGDGAHDAGSSGPADMFARGVPEAIPVTDPLVEVGEKVETEMDKEAEPLVRKRKESDDVGRTSDVPPAKRNAGGERSAGGPSPKTFKHWLSSLPAEDWKVEMFDNYVSAQDSRVFAKETLDVYLANLIDDVTWVGNFYRFVLFLFSFFWLYLALT